MLIYSSQVYDASRLQTDLSLVSSSKKQPAKLPVNVKVPTTTKSTNGDTSSGSSFARIEFDLTLEHETPKAIDLLADDSTKIEVPAKTKLKIDQTGKLQVSDSQKVISTYTFMQSQEPGFMSGDQLGDGSYFEN